MIGLALLQVAMTAPPAPAMNGERILRCEVFSRDGKRHVVTGDYRLLDDHGELSLTGKSRLLPLPFWRKRTASVGGRIFAMTVREDTEYRYDLQLSLRTGIMLVSTRKIPSGLDEYVGTGICDVATRKAAR